MDKIVAVWINRSLAQYKISGGRGGIFTAELVKYDGPMEKQPPREFLLHKEGRHWIDDDTNQDLLDELGRAIELQINDPLEIANLRRQDYGGRDRD